MTHKQIPAHQAITATDHRAVSLGEDNRHLLAREIRHRLKNMLAMLQAIVLQSMRDVSSIEQARDAIVARIAALSEANDILMQENTGSAEMREIVRRALRAHDDANASRFRLNGPDITLDQTLALSLALVLHEMATNAVKHGALSRDSGAVGLDWQVLEDASGLTIELRWIEHGGPPVKAPEHEGFGLRLIRRGFGVVGSTAELRFPETGVTLLLRAPVTELQKEPCQPLAESR